MSNCVLENTNTNMKTKTRTKKYKDNNWFKDKAWTSEKNLRGVQVQVKGVKLFRPTTLNQVLRTLQRETKYAGSASVYVPLACRHCWKAKEFFHGDFWHLSCVMSKCNGQTCLNICKIETQCTRLICTFCGLAHAWCLDILCSKTCTYLMWQHFVFKYPSTMRCEIND